MPHRHIARTLRGMMITYGLGDPNKRDSQGECWVNIAKLARMVCKDRTGDRYVEKSMYRQLYGIIQRGDKTPSRELCQDLGIVFAMRAPEDKQHVELQFDLYSELCRALAKDELESRFAERETYTRFELNL